jgi:UDP-N-acetylmuramoylalanine--D-glutamate ligase
LPEEPIQNVQAAFAICHQFGIAQDLFYQAYQTFKKPPHRMEYLGKIDGICFYNDSKSSNVDSVLYAVKGLQDSLIMIVGGVDKGASYQPWVKHFLGKVKHVIAYGAAREKIAKEIGVELPLTTIELFADAVSLAIAKAEVGDTVVLSPGCSSYDQFRNFEHRGDTFKELIQQRRYGTKENNSHCSIH